jgi:hypothetical protein
MSIKSKIFAVAATLTLAGGTVFDNQMWSADFGVLP